MSSNPSGSPRVVVDTNIILVALTSHSRWYKVFEALREGAYTLVVSNDIITEYAEKIFAKYDRLTAENFLRTLLVLPNVERQEIYFRWNLIPSDPDDNKFVDCAIASSADYLVSEDRHYNVLAGIEFPVVNVLRLAEFAERYIQNPA